MSKDNLNINFKSYSGIFIKEPFTKREAWKWLVYNAVQISGFHQIKTTLSLLAQEWKWPKTKVSRFLTDLANTKLITKESNAFSTTIKFIQAQILKTTSLTSNYIDQNQVKTEFGIVNEPDQLQPIYSVEEGSETKIKAPSEAKDIKSTSIVAKIHQLGQERNYFGTEIGTMHTKDKYGLQATNETEVGTISKQTWETNNFSEAQKEEKKKRNKKRKEEVTKEKYSLKGIQKERYERNKLKNSANLIEVELEANSIQGLSSCKIKTQSNQDFRKTTEQVEIHDIALWAADNIPSIVNLEWELSKFQDYYRATSKKKPKDGVAAFRNWLRNSIEFKKLNIGDHLNDGCSRNQTRNQFKETTGIERFLAAGVRAIAEFEKR